MGYAIAAWMGRVATVSRDGLLVWFDKTSWHQAALSALLPLGSAEFPQESFPHVTYTNDGTLWLKWYRLWQFDGDWHAVTFGSKDSAGVPITGTVPGQLWTEWKNGLVVTDPKVRSWHLFSWEEMHGPGSNWIFGMASAPDGTIWVAASNGLLHFDG